MKDRYTDDYDIKSLDDIDMARQAFLSDFDKDNRLKHFFDKSKGHEGERRVFEEIEEPIMIELNQKIEKEVKQEISITKTTAQLNDIDVPQNIMKGTTKRLEGAKKFRGWQINAENIRQISHGFEKEQLGRITSAHTKLGLRRVELKIKREAPTKSLRRRLLGILGDRLNAI